MTKLDAFVRFIKDFFRARTEEEILRMDLHEALLARNSAEDGVEYATSMVGYNEKKIARINQRLTQIRRDYVDTHENKK
jgi:hypothetical protein